MLRLKCKQFIQLSPAVCLIVKHRPSVTLRDIWTLLDINMCKQNNYLGCADEIMHDVDKCEFYFNFGDDATYSCGCANYSKYIQNSEYSFKFSNDMLYTIPSKKHYILTINHIIHYVLTNNLCFDIVNIIIDLIYELFIANDDNYKLVPF